MNFINKYGKGILICLLIAIPSWIIGKMFPVIGGAVIAILAGMIIAMFWNDKGKAEVFDAERLLFCVSVIHTREG